MDKIKAEETKEGTDPPTPGPDPTPKPEDPPDPPTPTWQKRLQTFLWGEQQ
jgi:hypothetical protein